MILSFNRWVWPRCCTLSDSKLYSFVLWLIPIRVEFLYQKSPRSCPVYRHFAISQSIVWAYAVKVLCFPKLKFCRYCGIPKWALVRTYLHCARCYLCTSCCVYCKVAEILCPWIESIGRHLIGELSKTTVTWFDIDCNWECLFISIVYILCWLHLELKNVWCCEVSIKYLVNLGKIEYLRHQGGSINR